APRELRRYALERSAPATLIRKSRRIFPRGFVDVSFPRLALLAISRASPRPVRVAGLAPLGHCGPVIGTRHVAHVAALLQRALRSAALSLRV
ncbi:MAG TPA: hypothetical protein VER33_09050, partial [Polyangiaceae bacterium]|nr:hypothetical protein [Polyangiaceae bacterium]